MPPSAEPAKVCLGTADDTVTLDQKQRCASFLGNKFSWEMVPMTAAGASARSPDPCAFANAGFGNP